MTAFLRYFLAAVRTLFPESCRDTAALLEATEEPSATALAHSLLNDLIAVGESFILVLEDYHHVREPAVHELVDRRKYGRPAASCPRRHRRQVPRRRRRRPQRRHAGQRVSLYRRRQPTLAAGSCQRRPADRGHRRRYLRDLPLGRFSRPRPVSSVGLVASRPASDASRRGKPEEEHADREADMAERRDLHRGEIGHGKRVVEKERLELRRSLGTASDGEKRVRPGHHSGSVELRQG